MPSGKKRVVSSDQPGMSSMHAAAVEAHLNAKEEGVPKSDELTSLNKLLQWSTANSQKSSNTNTDANTNTNTNLTKKDGAWLSSMFPDMNAAIKQIIKTLDEELRADGKPEDIAELLKDMEEYLADINYARNVGPLKVFPVLSSALKHRSPAVRANALWALGNALQDMPDNCKLFVDTIGMEDVVKGLSDDSVNVKCKALRTVSALLRASPSKTVDVVRDMAREKIIKLLSDADMQVRSRVLFFAGHASAFGHSWILGDLLNLKKNDFVEHVRTADASDFMIVEPIADTVLALIEHNRLKLIRVYPTLKQELSRLVTRCNDEELINQLNQCVNKLQ